MDENNAKCFHFLIHLGALDVYDFVRCPKLSNYLDLRNSLKRFASVQKISDIEYKKRKVIFQSPKFFDLFCKSLAQKIAPYNPEVVVASHLNSLNFAQSVATHLAYIKKDVSVVIPVYAYDMEGGFISSSKRNKNLSNSNVVIVSNFRDSYVSENQVLELLKYYGCKIIGIGSLFDHYRNTFTKHEAEVKVYCAVDIDSHVEKISSCEVCIGLFNTQD